MRRRALVLETSSSGATVVLPGGEFRRLRLRGPVTVGQEVWIETGIDRVGGYRWPAAAAAAAAGVGILFLHLLAPTPLAAVVSLDFRPSLNLSVNAAGRVVAVEPFNQAARALDRREPVVGMNLKAAVLALTKAGVENGMVSRQHPYLLLGGAVESRSDPWFRAVAHAEVQLVHQRHWPLEVVVAETHDQPNRIEARSVSVGRYLLAMRTLGGSSEGAATVSLATLLSQSGVVASSPTPSSLLPPNARSD